MHVFHAIFVKIVCKWKKRAGFHWCLLFQVFPHLCVCNSHFSFRLVCLLNMQYTSFIGSSYINSIWLSVYFHMEMIAKNSNNKKRFQVSFFFLISKRTERSVGTLKFVFSFNWWQIKIALIRLRVGWNKSWTIWVTKSSSKKVPFKGTLRLILIFVAHWKVIWTQIRLKLPS